MYVSAVAALLPLTRSLLDLGEPPRADFTAADHGRGATVQSLQEGSGESVISTVFNAILNFAVLFQKEGLSVNNRRKFIKIIRKRSQILKIMFARLLFIFMLKILAATISRSLDEK